MHSSIPIIISNNISWYELLDSGNGKKLERFGTYTIVRPESEALWTPTLSDAEWEKVNAIFEKKEPQSIWHHQGGPTSWNISFDNITCKVHLTPFGHVGIFPEQYTQWQWIEEKIKKSSRQLNILSLFGYTGIATLIAAKNNAKVTHVDASKPSVAWASENLKLSNLADKPVRWIIDDAFKFVKREIKRGNKYDAIIMDPPKFGRGPQGEVWKFEESFPDLLYHCRQILSPHPEFVLVNAYAIPISVVTLGNMMEPIVKDHGGKVEFGELGLLETAGKRILSTSLFAKWFS